MSVAAYDADVALDSAGVLREVPALRRMVVPELGRPPQRARPVDYDDGDTWDRRYLGAAIDLGGRLQRLANGLTSRLPDGEGRTPGFFRLVLPSLENEPAFDAELLADHLDRAPGDTLIGAAITDLGQRGDFAARWDDVFEFRDDGAEWGIVALDQAVRSEPLVGSVEDALNASVEVAVAPPASPVSAPTTVPAGSDGATSPAAGGTGPGTGPAASPPPTSPQPTNPSEAPPAPPPILPEPPPALEPALEPVDSLLGDLLDGLLGGLAG